MAKPTREVSYQEVLQGSNAPTTSPEIEGQIYVDSTNNAVYKSVGTFNASDWIL